MVMMMDGQQRRSFDMTFHYKLFKNGKTNKTDQVRRSADGNWDSKEWVIIPFDTGNTDYQEYLKWVEAGNTADPAD